MADKNQRLEKAALIAEIVAALGVIISILYLGTELRANNAALRAQTHYNALSLFNQHMLLSVENDGVAELLVRGDAEPSLLTPAEWRRYVDLLTVAVNSWEYAYYLNESRAVPPELWEGGDASYRAWATSAQGAKAFWRERSFIYADPFGSYANEFFAQAIAAE